MVVADVVTAAGLSAFAFVVGRFVYLGHEKVWDYYSSLRTGTEVRQLVYCLLRAVGEIVPLARPGIGAPSLSVGTFRARHPTQ